MVRLLLVLLIVFLITRLFVVYGAIDTSGKKDIKPEEDKTKQRKGVPKGIGDYVDYEEVKERES